MTSEVKIVFDLTQGAWADLHDKQKPKTQDDAWPLRDNVEWLGVDRTELFFGRLPGGVSKAAGSSPAVIIRANRPDGSTVLIETSLDVFVEAAMMMAALNDAEKQTDKILKRI
jgi:hypothetical protein